MSYTNVSINGVTYLVPDPTQVDWGQNVTDTLVALADPDNLFQPGSGTFTLTATADFGGAFGLKSSLFSSRAAAAASAGLLRLGVSDVVNWRNNANSADLTLAVNGSDQLTFEGNVISIGSFTIDRAIISDGSGNLAVSAVTSTELGYVGSVTSAIQTQLDAKASLALDNLASVQCNTSLISDTHDTDDLGTLAKKWRTGYFGTSIVLEEAGAGTDVITIDAPATLTPYSLTLPSTAGTVNYSLITDGAGNLDYAFNGQALSTDIERHGFTDLTETSISFTPGTFTFTLTDAGGGWSYYRDGIKYTISGNKTIVISGSPPATDCYYISIDATDGTLSVSTTIWDLLDSRVPVAAVSWNDTLTPKYFLEEQRHSCLVDKRWHYMQHFTEGTKLATRGALTGYTFSSDVDANKTFAIAESLILDEDIRIVLAALSQPNGVDTDYVTFYRTDATTWVWANSNMPFRYGGTYILWDNFNDGGGIETGINNRYYNSYLVFSTFQNDDGRFMIIDGREEFSSLALAQTEDLSEFDMTGYPVTEGVIVYQLTWSSGAANSSSGKVTLEAITAVTSSTSQSALSGASTDHNTLAGLQGGTTNEFYHLTSAEHTALTGLTADRAIVSNGSGDLTFAVTTAAEIGFINGLSSAVQTQIDSKLTIGTTYRAPSFTVATLPAGTGGDVIFVTDANPDPALCFYNGTNWIDVVTNTIVTT